MSTPPSGAFVASSEAAVSTDTDLALPANTTDVSYSRDDVTPKELKRGAAFARIVHAAFAVSGEPFVDDAFPASDASVSAGAALKVDIECGTTIAVPTLWRRPPHLLDDEGCASANFAADSASELAALGSTAPPAVCPDIALLEALARRAPLPLRGGTEWCFLRDEFRSADVMQGSVGNCWFIAGVSLVAQRPELMRRIFRYQLEDEDGAPQARPIPLAPLGLYQVVLCVAGQWRVVNIDDRVPVHAMTGGAAYAVTRRRQAWVGVLEKAAAKAYGSYAAMHGGLISDTLRMLTGAPVQSFWLRTNELCGDRDERLSTAAEKRGFLDVARAALLPAAAALVATSVVGGVVALGVRAIGASGVPSNALKGVRARTATVAAAAAAIATTIGSAVAAWGVAAAAQRPWEFRWSEAPPADRIDALWTRLCGFSEQGFLIGACSTFDEAMLVDGIVGVDPNVPDAASLRELRLRSARASKRGIVTMHAYAVLRLYECPQRKLRLLQLRNPWGGRDGHGERATVAIGSDGSVGKGSAESPFLWKGDWSDASDLWECSPDLRTALSPGLEASEGIFWMALGDFVECFVQIDVAHVRREAAGWHTTRVRFPLIATVDDIRVLRVAPTSDAPMTAEICALRSHPRGVSPLTIVRVATASTSLPPPLPPLLRALTAGSVDACETVSSDNTRTCMTEIEDALRFVDLCVLQEDEESGTLVALDNVHVESLRANSFASVLLPGCAPQRATYIVPLSSARRSSKPDTTVIAVHAAGRVRVDVVTKPRQWLLRAIAAAAAGANALAAKDPRRSGSCGATPLHVAAQLGLAEVCAELAIAGGVNTRTKDDESALMRGVWSARADVVDALIAAGAVTGPVDFFVAAMTGDERVVDALLCAAPRSVVSRSKLPLATLAAMRLRAAVVGALLRAGAADGDTALAAIVNVHGAMPTDDPRFASLLDTLHVLVDSGARDPGGAVMAAAAATAAGTEVRAVIARAPQPWSMAGAVAATLAVVKWSLRLFMRPDDGSGQLLISLPLRNARILSRAAIEFGYLALPPRDGEPQHAPDPKCRAYAMATACFRDAAAAYAAAGSTEERDSTLQCQADWRKALQRAWGVAFVTPPSTVVDMIQPQRPS